MTTEKTLFLKAEDAEDFCQAEWTCVLLDGLSITGRFESLQAASFLDICIAWLSERLQRSSFLDICIAQRASFHDICIAWLYERLQSGSFLDIFITGLLDFIVHLSSDSPRCPGRYGLIIGKDLSSVPLRHIPIEGSCDVKYQGVTCVSIQKFHSKY